MNHFRDPEVSRLAQQLLGAMQDTDQALRELKNMAATGIRLNQDFALIHRGDGIISWIGAGDFEEWEGDKVFETESEAINNAYEELAEISLPEIEEPVQEKDFVLSLLSDGYHWESRGPVFRDKYYSESFVTQQAAIDDAISFLTEMYFNDPDDRSGGSTDVQELMALQE